MTELRSYSSVFQDFHFDIPLRVSDILRVMKDSISFPLSVMTSLLNAARLAVFADICKVGLLSQAA